MFQSTLPTRGSDASSLGTRNYHRCFNPRSPRGGATRWRGINLDLRRVSIHAPHEGERPGAYPAVRAVYKFQSTLPTRGSDALYASCRRWRSSFQSTLPTRGSDGKLRRGLAKA